MDLVQSALYTCMELAQWNPNILLMYTKEKINKNEYAKSSLVTVRPLL
jgi:hypothetical protein